MKIGNRYLYLNKYFLHYKNITKYQILLLTLYIIIPNYHIYIIFSEKTKIYKYIILISAHIINLILYFYLSITDSGITSENKLTEQEEASIINKEFEEFEINDITIDNNNYKLYYCRRCKIYKNLRNYHCNACNVCIKNLQFHCNMFNNCIGNNNFVHFFLFLILNLYLFAIIAYNFYNTIFIRTTSYSNMIFYLNIYFMLIVIFILILAIINLAIIIYFILYNKNFYEYLNLIYLENNPFNNGIISNIKYFITPKKTSEINNIINAKSTDSLEIILK